MNKYIVTGQILSQIKLKKKNLFFILLYIPNNIKKISFFKLLININSNILKDTFRLYKINDTCTIEGNLHNINYRNNKSLLFLDIEVIALNM